MRSVEEHLTAGLKAVGPVTPIDASLADSAGCILAEDLMTTAELPAHPLAECDGYALRAEDTYTPGGAGPGPLAGRAGRVRGGRRAAATGRADGRAGVIRCASAARGRRRR